MSQYPDDRKTGYSNVLLVRCILYLHYHCHLDGQVMSPTSTTTMTTKKGIILFPVDSMQEVCSLQFAVSYQSFPLSALTIVSLPPKFPPHIFPRSHLYFQSNIYFLKGKFIFPKQSFVFPKQHLFFQSSIYFSKGTFIFPLSKNYSYKLKSLR